MAQSIYQYPSLIQIEYHKYDLEITFYFQVEWDCIHRKNLKRFTCGKLIIQPK